MHLLLILFTLLAPVNIFGSIEGNIGSDYLTCPANIYSSEYERYMEKSRAISGFVIEPQIYGTASDIEGIIGKIPEEDISRSGMVYLFSDLDFTTVEIFNCGDDCSEIKYAQALQACNTKHGGCIDLAAVVDGHPQCLLFPRPEF